MSSPLFQFLRSSFVLLVVMLVLLALSPTARALNPAPDGGYPNGNTAEGDFALNALTNGQNNVAVGGSALFNNALGSDNTAVGGDALLNNNGEENTALGFQTLFSNTEGGNNTATGSQALRSNTIGNLNTATGDAALEFNTTGSNNTASGVEALLNNTTGNENTATGDRALSNNTTANFNTATGQEALRFNTKGNNNTADGSAALIGNTIGTSNTAVGAAGLGNNTTGSNNTALGVNAGQNLTTGSNNIVIGANVPGLAKEANTTRIGKQGTQKNTFVAGIFGTAVTGSTVVVNSTGKLGVATSSARFKEAIKPMDKASEAILALKPVTFRYKEELDPDKIPQFGLIAEEVEKVNPDLVVRDEDGKISTVRYEAVNAMLLNEFLKEHRKNEEQQAMIERQQKQIDSLLSGLRELNEKTQLAKPAAQTVAANQ